MFKFLIAPKNVIWTRIQKRSADCGQLIELVPQLKSVDSPSNLIIFLFFEILYSYFYWSYWILYGLSFVVCTPKVYLTILLYLLYFCKLVMTSGHLTKLSLLSGRNYYFISNTTCFQQEVYTGVSLWWCSSWFLVC